MRQWLDLLVAKSTSMRCHGAVGHDQGASGAACRAILVLKHCVHPRALSSCRCLSQPNIYDCGQLPSCVQLLGEPCVAYLGSTPASRERYDGLQAPHRAALLDRELILVEEEWLFAQEWCRIGQLNHSGSSQEPLLGLDVWKFGVQFPGQKQGVCVSALLSPGRFCPRHWHPSCTAVEVWTRYRSWRLQQKA